ncbi:MAG: hypothetical protein HYZ23_01505 [Chloroflexi bacterium]|nr:hypothetical protein [Chloroflexota bacterium]
MNLGNSEDRKLTEKEKAARFSLKQAVSLHLQGNKAGALKALRQALAADPSTAQETLAVNLARELTGKSIQEAVSLFANEETSRSMIKSAAKQEKQSARSSPANLSTIALFALTAVMLGMIVYGIAFHKFDNAIARVRLLQQQAQVTQSRHISGTYEYFLFVPTGDPPEGGWPVVVAVHGYGGQAGHMTWLADQFTSAGAIFIAPTFGSFEPNPGDGPIEPMSRILVEVGMRHPIQPRAAFLGLSQGGSFSFRFSLRHPEQVIGVVTAGAPEYDQGVPPPPDMPYYFSWGENDGLQDYVVPGHVVPLQQAGYSIVISIIPGYGHEVTPYTIEKTLGLIR